MSKSTFVRPSPFRGIWVWTVLVLLLLGCSSRPQRAAEDTPRLATTPTEAAPAASDGLHADVIAVTVTGEDKAYRFSVEVHSPDTGCDQYADWWEVLTEDGGLLYRRILAHSHVDEQPFVRSGGPVGITPDAVVIVRAHLHPGGYGGQAMKGSVQDGFEAVAVGEDFAAGVESLEPQPSGCAF